ncbi:DUF5666 domain-containing protein [Nocardia vinacea]|uniref:DUF5666 domain-containing protein n=1 Tax=Nocardia vinacea TaxID=96468 RepID=A0ABZ1Z4H9_9NOCA|nr:DUF5666 domain-containing protein [Nocardia vinacea]
MSSPNDPWAQRPEDAPTEHIGPSGESGFQPSPHTAEYTDAYGHGDATSVYPSTEQYEPWGPPPVNATKEFPPYDSQVQWGGQESGVWQEPTQVGAYGQPGAQYPPGPPGGNLPSDQQPPRKRNTGLWIALGLGVILLIGAVGVLAGVLMGDKDTSSSSAASTSAFPTAGRPTGTAPSGGPSSPPVLPSIPGLGGIDNLGATMGTITANAGGQLTLDTVGGSAVTVRTTDKTQVISLTGSKASDLPVGDMVVVQGDKVADGSIDAKIIISTALPGGTR